MHNLSMSSDVIKINKCGYNLYKYINLRRSRDCLCMSVAAGRPAAFLCVIALLHLLILGKCYAVHINAGHCNESVHRKKHYTRGNNTIPYKLARLATFEVEIFFRDQQHIVYEIRLIAIREGLPTLKPEQGS